MRIAYVTETYPPELNGVSLTVQRTVRHLSERGHDIELIRPRQPGDTNSTRSASDPAAVTRSSPSANPGSRLSSSTITLPPVPNQIAAISAPLKA